MHTSCILHVYFMHTSCILYAIFTQLFLIKPSEPKILCIVFFEGFPKPYKQKVTSNYQLSAKVEKSDFLMLLIVRF